MATDPSSRQARSFQSLHLLTLALFFGIVLALLVGRAMGRGLVHDEYHYVTGGALVSEGLGLPYVDYPYIHTPYLAFVYAPLFSLTNYTLLAARLFSVLCMALSVGVLFFFASGMLRDKPWWKRFAVGAFGGLLLVSSPLFIRVGGLAVNHQLPTLLTLLALAVFYRGQEHAHPERYFFIAGLLVGLAIGVRVSYVVGLAAFLAAIFLPIQRGAWRSQIRQALALLAGAALALAPLLVLFLAAPKGFIFGNYVYFQLNAAYRQSLGFADGMTPLGKLAYFAVTVLPELPTLVLYLAFLAYTLIAWRNLRCGEDRLNSRLLLASDLGLLLFATSFIGTPTWAQYFFASVPFMILVVMFGIVAPGVKRIKLNQVVIGLALLVFLLTGGAGEMASSLGNLASPQEWFPMRAHALGAEIQSLVPGGKVLTLTPIFPLESDLEIYNQFVAGPFVWRAAPLLSEEKRREYDVISYEELESYLADDPPDAILTGFEAPYDGFTIGDIGGLEKPLIDYALAHGYRPVALQNNFGLKDIVLWVR